MKHLCLKYSWLLLILLLASCWKEPTYPQEPTLTGTRVSQNVEKTVLGTSILKIQIAADFQDGDGNLGLGAADTLAPYDDAPGNKFFYNFFVDVFVKYAGQTEYVAYNPSAITYNGRFLLLSPDDESRTLEGELRYKFDIIPGIGLQSGDMLKFRIQIADRALNLSNTVETEPILLQL